MYMAVTDACAECTHPPCTHQTVQVLRAGEQIASTQTFRSGEGNVEEMDLAESELPYELVATHLLV